MRKSRLLFCLLFLFIGFCSQDALAATEMQSAQAESLGGDFAYRIGPQNLLQIKILGESATTQVYRVDEMGYITHALLGRLKLQGLTVVEIERLVTDKLRGQYILHPTVTIFVVEHSHFSILGEVRRPGNYEITGRVSIIEALSMAGGFTPLANQKGVKIVRKKEGDEQILHVNAVHLMQNPDPNNEVDIEANDVIVVPKSFF